MKRAIESRNDRNPTLRSEKLSGQLSESALSKGECLLTGVGVISIASEFDIEDSHIVVNRTVVAIESVRERH